MARPKKLEQEIEQEAGLTAVAEAPKANEFDDEYTLEVTHDFDPNADIFRISNKDPNYEYRFIRSDDKTLSLKTNALLYQKGGWQIVPKTHLQRIGIKEAFLAPDGSYRVGELILCFMPKALFEKKVAAKNQKANARLEAIDRRLAKGDPSVGNHIKDFAGLQTQKQLKGNFKED